MITKLNSQEYPHYLLKIFVVFTADKFQKGDLALALLEEHVSEIVQTIHHHVVRNNVNRVFVGGSLTNRELVRTLMVKALVRLDNLMKSAHGKVKDFYRI